MPYELKTFKCSACGDKFTQHLHGKKYVCPHCGEEYGPGCVIKMVMP